MLFSVRLLKRERKDSTIFCYFVTDHKITIEIVNSKHTCTKKLFCDKTPGSNNGIQKSGK